MSCQNSNHQALRVGFIWVGSVPQYLNTNFLEFCAIYYLFIPKNRRRWKTFKCIFVYFNPFSS